MRHFVMPATLTTDSSETQEAESETQDLDQRL